jgi:hypothetical protein
MKRDVSYSDSFFVLSKNGDTKLEPLFLSIQGTNEPIEHRVVEVEAVETVEKIEEKILWLDKGVLFVIKGSLHIFFISAFETIFYFLYVSKSEDTGIMNTINTYYMPLIQSCDTWSNRTRALLLDILTYEINKSSVDIKGIYAAQAREEFNMNLLHWSIAYSGICLGIFSLMVGVVVWKKIQIHWIHLFSEHLLFVFLLGLYEYFFFRTIIYPYQTISTDELNQYLVDEAFQCLETGYT